MLSIHSMLSRPSFTSTALETKALANEFDWNADRCCRSRPSTPTRQGSISLHATTVMTESRDPSESCDVMRTAPSPTILHYPTRLTLATPNLASPIVQVNRSLPSTRRGHDLGNEPALDNAVPWTSGWQPHTCYSQGAAMQQQPPFINNIVRDNSVNDRQWDVIGVQDDVGETTPRMVYNAGLGELIDVTILAITC